MKYRAQLLAIIGLLIFGSAVDQQLDANGVEASQDEALSEEHVIVGGNIFEQLRVQLAIALYERAGLHLEALRIYIHDGQAGCNGNGGLFNKDGSGNRIDLCGDLIRHELAHAWTHHNLDDATRAAFVEHAGLNTWYGENANDYRVRGVELAAKAISWNVDVKQLEAGQLDLYEDFLSRYELLTGRASLRIAHLAEISTS